ncbi:MAG TPA: glycosyltransferase [Bryobacteraceae bacterium]|nr:glycosyltransferase [Bryobacteraceae bacterium]
MSVAAMLLLQLIVLVLFAVGVACFGAMLKGCFVLRRLVRTRPRYEGTVIQKSPLVSPVSVIVVPPDASPRSRAFAHKLVDLQFGKHELVLVLDGPSNVELETWIEEFHLCQSARGGNLDLATAPIRGIYESRDPLPLVVLDKDRGGQADALNAGVNVAVSPVIALLDPESEFEPTVLLSLIRPMLHDPGRTIAVCGVMPAPEESSDIADASPGGSQSTWASLFGALETLRRVLGRCAALSGWNRLIPVPGAALLVLRDAVVKVGGFTAGPMELFLHLHGHARASGRQYKVAFVPEAASHLRVAASFADLERRNLREDADLAKALAHRNSIDGGFNAIGWGLPGILCVRLLRPLLETAAYALALVGLLTGWIDPALAGLVLLSTVGMGILISMSAVVLRELAVLHASDPARLAWLFFASIPENLGYRQIRNLWLIAGFFSSPNRSRA